MFSRFLKFAIETPHFMDDVCNGANTPEFSVSKLKEISA